MFDHVKRLKDWTTMTCHVYNCRYYKVLIIACCEMQSEDNATQIFFWKKLNFVIAENCVPNVNFKGFMTDSAQVTWNTVRTIYGDGSPCLSMVARERTCLSNWYASLDKVTQKYIKFPLQFKHKQICEKYKDAQTMDDAKTKYHVIRSCGCQLELPRRNASLAFQSGWVFGTFVTDNGVVICYLLSINQNSLFNVIQFFFIVIYILCLYLIFIFVYCS